MIFTFQDSIINREPFVIRAFELEYLIAIHKLKANSGKSSSEVYENQELLEAFENWESYISETEKQIVLLKLDWLDESYKLDPGMPNYASAIQWEMLRREELSADFVIEEDEYEWDLDHGNFGGYSFTTLLIIKHKLYEYKKEKEAALTTR